VGYRSGKEIFFSLLVPIYRFRRRPQERLKRKKRQHKGRGDLT